MKEGQEEPRRWGQRKERKETWTERKRRQGNGENEIEVLREEKTINEKSR